MKLASTHRLIAVVVALLMILALGGSALAASDDAKDGVYIAGEVMKFYTFAEFGFGAAELRADIAAEMTQAGVANVFVVEAGYMASVRDIVDVDGFEAAKSEFEPGDLGDEPFTDTDEEEVLPPVPAISLTVTPAEVELAVGATETLTVVMDPAEAEVTFSSDDEEVVTVDEDGVLVAVASGEATITVEATYEELTPASVEVVVTVFELGSITGAVTLDDASPRDGIEVTVTAGDYSDVFTTDETGVAEYELEAREGTYTVVASAEGYEEDSELVEVTEGEVTEDVDLTLEPILPQFIGISTEAGSKIVTLHFSEPVYAFDTVTAGDFTVTTDGVDNTVTAVDIADDPDEAADSFTITLTDVAELDTPTDVTITTAVDYIGDLGHNLIADRPVTKSETTIEEAAGPTFDDVTAVLDGDLVTLYFSEAVHTGGVGVQAVGIGREIRVLVNGVAVDAQDDQADVSGGDVTIASADATETIQLRLDLGTDELLAAGDEVRVVLDKKLLDSAETNHIRNVAGTVLEGDRILTEAPETVDAGLTDATADDLLWGADNQDQTFTVTLVEGLDEDETITLVVDATDFDLSYTPSFTADGFTTTFEDWSDPLLTVILTADDDIEDGTTVSVVGVTVANATAQTEADEDVPVLFQRGDVGKTASATFDLVDSEATVAFTSAEAASYPEDAEFEIFSFDITALDEDIQIGDTPNSVLFIEVYDADGVKLAATYDDDIRITKVVVDEDANDEVVLYEAITATLTSGELTVDLSQATNDATIEKGETRTVTVYADLDSLSLDTDDQFSFRLTNNDELFFRHTGDAEESGALGLASGQHILLGDADTVYETELFTVRDAFALSVELAEEQPEETTITVGYEGIISATKVDLVNDDTADITVTDITVTVTETTDPTGNIYLLDADEEEIASETTGATVVFAGLSIEVAAGETVSVYLAADLDNESDGETFTLGIDDDAHVTATSDIGGAVTESVQDNLVGPTITISDMDITTALHADSPAGPEVTAGANAVVAKFTIESKYFATLTQVSVQNLGETDAANKYRLYIDGDYVQTVTDDTAVMDFTDADHELAPGEEIVITITSDLSDRVGDEVQIKLHENTEIGEVAIDSGDEVTAVHLVVE